MRNRLFGINDVPFTWNLLWIILFAIGMGVFLIGTPKYIDDYWYMLTTRTWFESQGIFYPENGGNIFAAGLPFDAILASWSDHWYGDNARLGNLLVTIFLLFPKWFGSGLMWGCFLYSMWGSFQLSGIYWHRSPLVPIALGMWMFLLPWREYMGCMVYQFNYIFPTALAMICLFIVFKRSRGWKYPISAVLIGFFCGMSHEGISVPLTGGLMALVLFFNELRSKRSYALIVGLMIGILFLFISPGARMRFGLICSEFIINMWDLLFTSIPLMVMLVLVLYRIIKVGYRSVASDRMIIFCTISSLISIGIVLKTGVMYRGGWWAIFSSIIGILYLLRINFGNFWNEYNFRNSLVCSLSLILVYMHIIVIDYYALYDRVLMSNAVKDYKRNPTKAVFGKVHEMKDLPLICGYTSCDFNTVGVIWPSVYYRNENKGLNGLYAIIPDCLKSANKTTGNEVKGGLGVREVEGYLYVPCLDINKASAWVWLYVDFGKGFRPVLTRRSKFVSVSDGKIYDYLVPKTDWYVTHFKTIRAISPKVEYIGY